LQELRDQLSPPVLQIKGIPVEPGWVYPSWKDGLDQLSQTKEQVPEPSKWSGTLNLDTEHVESKIRVRLPRQIDSSTEEVLRNVWSIFTKDRFNNVINLSDSNADRNCGECNSAARHYVHGGSISGFYCTSCLAKE